MGRLVDGVSPGWTPYPRKRGTGTWLLLTDAGRGRDPVARGGGGVLIPTRIRIHTSERLLSQMVPTLLSC